MVLTLDRESSIKTKEALKSPEAISLFAGVSGDAVSLVESFYTAQSHATRESQSSISGAEVFTFDDELQNTSLYQRAYLRNISKQIEDADLENADVGEKFGNRDPSRKSTLEAFLPVETTEESHESQHEQAFNERLEDTVQEPKHQEFEDLVEDVNENKIRTIRSRTSFDLDDETNQTNRASSRAFSAWLRGDTTYTEHDTSARRRKPFISDGRPSQSNRGADERLSSFLRNDDEHGAGKTQDRRDSFESLKSQDTITEQNKLGIASSERPSSAGPSFNWPEDLDEYISVNSAQARSKTGRPSLFDILARRSEKPYTLFDFYIYMRDVQRSVDYLDFW
jgi:hypothetical protein